MIELWAAETAVKVFLFSQIGHRVQYILAIQCSALDTSLHLIHRGQWMRVSAMVCNASVVPLPQPDSLLRS